MQGCYEIIIAVNCNIKNVGCEILVDIPINVVHQGHHESSVRRLTCEYSIFTHNLTLNLSDTTLLG